MDKNIIAIFALDEAVSLAIVEPLDRTKNSVRHNSLPPYGNSDFCSLPRSRWSCSALCSCQPNRPERIKLRP